MWRMSKFLILNDFMDQNYYVNKSLHCKMKVFHLNEIDSGMI